MNLTDKQKRFAEEYIVDLNATQAAIRAGYSEKTAKVIASENLTKPYVMEYVKGLMDERSSRTQITADMVLREYAKLAFSDTTDIVSVSVEKVPLKVGEEVQMIDAEVVKVKRTSELTPEQRASISEIKQGRNGIEVKFHDKKGALDSIARHLGMFNDKLDINAKVKHTKLEEFL